MVTLFQTIDWSETVWYMDSLIVIKENHFQKTENLKVKQNEMLIDDWSYDEF